MRINYKVALSIILIILNACTNKSETNDLKEVSANESLQKTAPIEDVIHTIEFQYLKSFKPNVFFPEEVVSLNDSSNVLEDIMFFEGGETFRAPELYYVDSDNYYFFNPFFMETGGDYPQIMAISKESSRSVSRKKYKVLNDYSLMIGVERGAKDRILSANCNDSTCYWILDRKPEKALYLMKFDLSEKSSSVVDSISCINEISVFSSKNINYHTNELEFFSQLGNLIVLNRGNLYYIYDLTAKEDVFCGKVDGVNSFLGINKDRELLFYNKYRSQVLAISMDNKIQAKIILAKKKKLRDITYDPSRNSIVSSFLDVKTLETQVYEAKLPGFPSATAKETK